MSAPIDIDALERERFAWALKTFPRATTLGSVDKLIDEAKEIREDIVNGTPNIEEFADVLMTLFDAGSRIGFTPYEIFKSFERKFEINKSRTWSDNQNGSYSHVK